jgi:ectoine hydroxylase-related dioxygenase (phytanoyl-CoA dioxygenase family)
VKKIIAEFRPCPKIDLSEQQDDAKFDCSSVLKEGAELYLKNGCLLIKNAFEPEFIQTVHDAFTTGYSRYLQDGTFTDALSVGDKRTMISVEITGPFSSPNLYANSKLMPLLQYLLSDQMILGSMGVVVSLPGAKRQHYHRDHSNIFDTKAVYDGGDACIPIIPPYAITLVVPLVTINKLNGTTRLWPGTHLLSDTEGFEGYRSDPYPALGDCYLMDYRLAHRGMENKSSQPRPILYNIYSRPWFRDAENNYAKQGRLLLPDAEYQSMPAEYRHLFDWSQESAGRAKHTDIAEP